MWLLRRRSSCGHPGGSRRTGAPALLLVVLMGLGSCARAEEAEDPEEGAPTIGWSLFLAASYQPQLVGMLQRTRPPWEAQDPLVIAIHPEEEPPRRYRGTLPPDALVRPTAPYTIFELGRFGPRVGPDNQLAEVHTGTDLSANEGLPVVAAMDGTVTDVFWDDWGGNRVEVAHVGGLTTTYNHLQHVQTEVGVRLRANEQLGTVGQTGLRVTGPHLHFETWVDGEVVDPQSFTWIDGDRIIPATRGPHPDVPVVDKQPLPASKRDSTAIAESWGLDAETVVVGVEKGDTPSPHEDGVLTEREELERDLQALRGRVQALEQELEELRALLPGPTPLPPTLPPGPGPTTELPPVTGSLAERVEALEAQLRGLQGQVGSLDEDLRRLVPQDLPQQLGQLRERADLLQRTVDDLAVQVAGAVALQERVAALEALVTGLREQVAALQGETAALRLQDAELQRQITLLQDRIARLEAGQGEPDCARLPGGCAPIG